MPVSRRRKKPKPYVPASAGTTSSGSTAQGPSPRWLAPLMLGLFALGVLWLVVFYLTEGSMGGIPVVEDIDNWNLLVGFGFIIAGFGLSTQWR